jgi:DNA helicase HerA-like ATPase
MGLSDVQEAVLQLVFKYCDDKGLLLLDLKDLKAALSFVADNAGSLGADYGLVSKASVGAIQRGLVTLDADGAEHFFGEPALDLDDLMRQDMSGRGVISVLAADRLYQKPALYSTFLLWLLAELFERLPEAGDLDRPKLVFFFDEAHLLFKDAPAALTTKVEQVVRLIRSKGVGIYFVTQNPLDVPDTVLGQLGNRVQHALRAFTPRDQKAVKAAAETFRANPKLDVAEAIQTLGVGEALVSCLGEGGIPGVVEKTLIRPPRSRIGAVTPDERKTVRGRSPIGAKYDTIVDRESAYEKLTQRTLQSAPPAAAPEAAPSGGQDRSWWDRMTGSAAPASQPAPSPAPAPAQKAPAARGSTRATPMEAAMTSVVRAVGSQVGRELGKELMRGLLGSLSRR